MDEGPTLKRWRARARGRATRIDKRTSHVKRGPHTDPGGVAWGRRFIPRASGSATSTTGSRPGSTSASSPDYLLEDVAIREHIENKLAHAGLSDINDRQAAGRGDRRHPHGPPGHRDRQVRLRGRRPAPRPPQADQQAGQGQHPGDQAPGARRQAGRPVDRRAAPEPGRLPARDEARAHLGHALRRQGREGPGLRPPGRRRDGAHRGLLRRPRPAPYPSRRHRLRLRRGPHNHRPHRRQVLDQQGRGHARGLPLGAGRRPGGGPGPAPPEARSPRRRVRRRPPAPGPPRWRRRARAPEGRRPG